MKTVGTILCFMATIWQIQGQCDRVQLVSRKEWLARLPRHQTLLHLPVNMTFIHHSAGPRCNTSELCSELVRDIQNLHMDINGWDDIGYNFLIGDNGLVYEGRGWKNQGAHALKYNAISHGICFLGNFMQEMPSEAALDAGKTLIQCAEDEGYIINKYELFGHRDGRCTECPGDELYKIIQTWPHYSHRQIPVVCGSSNLLSSLIVLTFGCVLSCLV